jgi:hypothetical protein
MLGSRSQGAVALHSTRKANTECLGRIIQRAFSRWVPQRARVRESRARVFNHRSMATDYNANRPHKPLRNQTPEEFARGLQNGSTTPNTNRIGKTLTGCRITGNLSNPSWTPPAVSAPSLSLNPTLTTNTSVRLHRHHRADFIACIPNRYQNQRAIHRLARYNAYCRSSCLQVMVGGMIELFGSLPLTWTWTSQ